MNLTKYVLHISCTCGHLNRAMPRSYTCSIYHNNWHNVYTHVYMYVQYKEHIHSNTPLDMPTNTHSNTLTQTHPPQPADLEGLFEIVLFFKICRKVDDNLWCGDLQVKDTVVDGFG